MTPQGSGTVLLVDDDPAIRKVIAALLEQCGIGCEQVDSAPKALEALARQPMDVVVSDLRMPDMSGMDLLGEIVESWPQVPVIVLTAHGSIPLAVEAMRRGAADFVTKPFDRAQLIYVVRKALEVSRRARDEVPRARSGGRMLVGESPAMQSAMALLRRVAPGSATVLIRGETGTGKEVFARAIHASGPLADKPFVKVDCASLPDALLESELFGYEKGAFTGASCRKPGRVELAQDGTLFLDEIGEVTPALQRKLLRVLQDREFELLGGVETLRTNARFVAATHRNLEEMMQTGSFREDLFYRLNVVPVSLPPLRERLEDLPALARLFCSTAAKANGVPEPDLPSSTIAALSAYEWPGNIRQLQNLIERLVVLSDTPYIEPEAVHRALDAAGRARGDSQKPASESTPPRPAERPLEACRRNAEREAVVGALQRAAGNRTLAARLLGVSRRTLHYKLKELGVE